MDPQTIVIWCVAIPLLLASIAFLAGQEYNERVRRRTPPPPAPSRDPRFFVYPGYITSRTDGQLHYISFPRLCQLYGIDPRRAVNMGHPSQGQPGYPVMNADGTRWLFAYGDGARGYTVHPEDKHLYPRPEGDYDEHAFELGLRGS